MLVKFGGPVLWVAQIAPHLLISILAEISAIVNDTKDLQKNYGLQTKEVTDADKFDFGKELLAAGNVVRVLDEIREKLRLKTTATKRFRRAIKDQAKFEKLLDKFHYLNEGLWNCLSAVSTDFLKLSLPTFVLPAIEDVAVLRQLQSISKESDQKFLASGAELSQIKIETDAWETQNVPEKGSIELPAVRFSGMKDVDGQSLTVASSEQSRTRDDALVKDRSLADYAVHQSDSRPVLIEWRDLSNVNLENRTLVTNRLRALGTFLMTNKMSEFHILSCIGVWNKDPSKIGFVFELPTSEHDLELYPVTLFQMLKLSSEGKFPTPALGDRFSLARTLASALALFHASKWLHKGLCSQNILFFRANGFEDDVLPSLDDPFIGGFDYSRPDRPGTVSGPSRLMIEMARNVYRHPDVQNEPIHERSTLGSDQNKVQNSVGSETVQHPTRFQKIHDIYSLGVILYEIGTWRLVSGDYLQFKGPEDFRDNLLRNCTNLGPRMGRRYEAVVRSCLKSEFGHLEGRGNSEFSEGNQQRAFWSNVIVELNECNA